MPVCNDKLSYQTNYGIARFSCDDMAFLFLPESRIHNISSLSLAYQFILLTQSSTQSGCNFDFTGFFICYGDSFR